MKNNATKKKWQTPKIVLFGEARVNTGTVLNTNYESYKITIATGSTTFTTPGGSVLTFNPGDMVVLGTMAAS